ncbi:MAG: dihydroneopterin aldolase family protein [Thermoplasmataceae archaeon]|jgi:hypothetical protein
MRDPAEPYFKCTDRERAIFEAGIKLGTVYHQYVGVPINLSNLASLAQAIKESLLVQPFVADAKVEIDPDVVKKKQGVYKYITLTGEMLNVMVSIKYRDISVIARLRFVKEMEYPLMYIEE